MTITNATDTSSTFRLIGLALSTSLLTLSAAESDPATKEDPALGMTARLEQDFGHDSNPTQGDAHTQIRNHAEQADDYWRTITSLSLRVSTMRGFHNRTFPTNTASRVQQDPAATMEEEAEPCWPL